MTVFNILGWGFLFASWMCTAWGISVNSKDFEKAQQIRVAAIVLSACAFTVFITALLTSGTVNK